MQKVWTRYELLWLQIEPTKGRRFRVRGVVVNEYGKSAIRFHGEYPCRSKRGFYGPTTPLAALLVQVGKAVTALDYQADADFWHQEA